MDHARVAVKLLFDRHVSNRTFKMDECAFKVLPRQPFSKLLHAYLGALGAVGLCLTPSVSAQQANAPDVKTDVVVRAPREKDLQATYSAYVKSMTDRHANRQLARWDRQICPQIVGVPPSQADFIVKRIGEIAAPLRLQTTSKLCTTTMLIIVDNDANQVVSSLVKRQGIALAEDEGTRLNDFAQSAAPVKWIAISDPCGLESCRVSISRLKNAETPVYRTMIVVVDGAQLGHTLLSELADYLAFVVLSNPPLNGTRPDNSIMSMFSRTRAGAERFGLTDDDRAFLKALYDSPPEGIGSLQRSGIIGNMIKSAAKKRGAP